MASSMSSQSDCSDRSGHPRHGRRHREETHMKINLPISGTDITLDGILTILDEHYNNVKALDTLNQELFQMRMANKETVSDWGICLS